MIYIIHGKEEYFIRKKIAEIISEKDAEVFRYDGSSKTFDVNQMLEYADSNSLFSSKNIIMVNEPFFLIKKCDDKILESLNAYVENPSYDTDLVLYTFNDNFSSKLKAFKTISKNAQVITCNQLDYKNFNNYVRESINEYKLDINNDAVTLLTNICKRSATLLHQNLEVLSLYPEKITVQAINKLCSTSDENDSFELVNALTNKQISKTISLTRKLMQSDDNAINVIYLLANQLRYLYHVAYLDSIGKKRHEIMDITGSSEYRLNKANETLSKLKMPQIMNLLSKLSEIDIKTKSDNSIPEQERLELFILDLLKRA